MTEPTKYPVDRVPYVILSEDPSPHKDTYGGVQGLVLLKAHLLKPARPSKTVFVMMHPIGGGEYLPFPHGLARAGHHVIYCGSRYPGVDSALIMEKVALDLAACIRDAKERLGYERVVLCGWSGGGSLSAFYQAQALNPTVTATPAGDPPDLTSSDLPAADALMLVAAHVSRATTLTESLDPSIVDEQDPTRRDPELDLYNSDSPNQPPYSAAFVERYRAAQVARNRRITAWVKEKLETLRASGRPDDEFAFVVHGTMADPRALDGTLDPNQRDVGTSFLGDPQVANMGPIGLARYTSLRSWLSQWSLDDTHADGLHALASVTSPVLVIGNMADSICTPSHTHRLYRAIPHDDKQLVEIDGATHYYLGQKDELRRAVGAVASWISDKGLAD